MSGAEQEPSVHLISLMEAAPDSRQQDRILTLASDGKIRLYVQRRPGHAVYASSAKRSLTNSVTPAMQERANRAKRRGIPVITNPTLRLEIEYLALAPQDARRLLEAKSAYVRSFRGGLKAVADEATRQHVGLEFTPSTLCLCPEAATIERELLILEAPEHAVRIEWGDVFLDRQEAALAADSSYAFLTKAASSAVRAISDQKRHGHQLTFDPVEDVPIDDQGLPPPMNTDRELEDPFQLQSRAPGVFVLYAAAKHFYGSGHVVSASQRNVESWLRDANNPIAKWAVGRSGSYSKLVNSSNATLAYKLIRPRHNEYQGEQADGAAKLLDAKTVRKALKKYRPEGKDFDHISRRLCVVMLAVDLWERLNKTAAPPKSNPSAVEEHQLRLIAEFGCELESWGFGYEDERETVIDFVIWPSKFLTARKKRERVFKEALQEKGKLPAT